MFNYNSITNGVNSRILISSLAVFGLSIILSFGVPGVSKDELPMEIFIFVYSLIVYFLTLPKIKSKVGNLIVFNALPVALTVAALGYYLYTGLDMYRACVLLLLFCMLIMRKWSLTLVFFLTLVSIVANIVLRHLNVDYLVNLLTLGGLGVIYRHIRETSLKYMRASITETNKKKEQNEELMTKNVELDSATKTDGLTGINNRCYFNSLSAEWFEEARKGEFTLGIIMMDIDKFKNYNDTYGHIQGDECLRTVAQTLNGKLRRDNERLFRYGGEEFVVVLKNANEVMTNRIAKGLCDAVKDQNIVHEGYDIGIVTLSMGVALVKCTTDATLKQIIEKADANLYKAKKNGRNQIVADWGNLNEL